MHTTILCIYSDHIELLKFDPLQLQWRNNRESGPILTFPLGIQSRKLKSRISPGNKSQNSSTNIIRTSFFSFIMAPSSNSTSRYLSVGYSGNRSSSAPPSTFTGTSSAFIRTPGAPQYRAIVIHPIIEAQTISFNDSLRTSEDITEMSNYSSSPNDYSYSLSARGTVPGSNQSTISQVSAF